MQDDSIQQNPPDNPGWLAKLQQESWQAEILISGGGFLGVIAMLDKYGDVVEALFHGISISPRDASFIIVPLFLLAFMLAQGFVLHLILRGYWVGLVGFNLVFPQGIKQETLAFRGKFKSFIKGNSNTPYLIKLDELCSVIFAFTFFIIFSIVGFFLFLLLMVVVMTLLMEVPDSRLLRLVVGGMFILSGLLVFIDFFTFGYLKKVRWISRLYYPIHYVMSRITLSFLYRRLYYSIISNIRPRFIILGLLAEGVIITLMIVVSHSFSKDISPLRSGKEHFLELKEEITSGNSLQFSFSHFPWLEGELYAEWIKTHKGAVAESFNEIPTKEKLDLITSAYIISIDSVQAENLTWMNTSREVLGFDTMSLTYIADISRLAPGRHELAMKMRLKNFEYTQDSVGYYAKAYFLVDKQAAPQ